MIKQSLHDNWTVRATGDLSEVPQPVHGLALPAQVPGCVTTDLLRAGKIEDPYLDENEFKTRWIGHTDWQYTLVFDADSKLFDHERIDLVADGLDTVATIVLNGSQIARTQNMHRGYRFDAHTVLKKGKNELTITFASPVKYANAMWDQLGGRPYCNGAGGRFNFIRKMACNFGWDWGPALPTSGIWRGIRLEGWSVARIAEVRPNVRHAKADDFHEYIDGPPAGVNPYTGKPWTPDDPLLFIDLSVRFEVTDAGRFRRPYFDRDNVAADLNIRLLDGEGKNVTTVLGRIGPMVDDTISIAVVDPLLWQPRGHGAQPLYRLELDLRAWGPDVKPPLLARILWPKWMPQTYGDDAKRNANELLDESSMRIGLRTVELDTSPDDIGRKFVLKVNGKPIFCKGFNWIPDDCFLDRACEPARVRQRIQQAADSGGNMLRVWGGGIYETDDFYDVCDEMGVLVWQDFLFACAMYPEEQPFWDEIEAEARYHVARLAHHPSLAIWNGCNENIWAYRNWGWREQLNNQTWGKNYYFELLPKICKEVTPTIPYWAGSPWSGDYDADNGVLPNADTHGNKHIWDADAVADYRNYRKYAPRFASEFGVQGPSNYSTIAKVVPPEGRDFGAPEMRHRQKAGDPIRDDADRKNLRQIVRDFNLPGAAELLAALDSPDPKAKLPECGCGPLHPAKALPSKVNFDDLHYLLSVQQCRALTTAVEFWRSRQPTCMGTLYWQLNDCWPGGTTWSCIDGDGKLKPLWYATRDFYRDQLATFQPEADGSLSLYLINDSDGVFEKNILIERHNFDGERLAGTLLEGVTVEPRSVKRIPVSAGVATPGDPTREVLHSNASWNSIWFFRPDNELRYPSPSFDAEFDGRELIIHAKTLLRDVCVFADRIDPDAKVSRQMATIFPGGVGRFGIESNKGLTKEQLTATPVFRCVNPFGKMV